MIVMGYVTETSIAALFIGGILPGILIGGALVATGYQKARRYETTTIESENLEMSKSRTLWEGLPALGMPLVVLGGILAGVFTATEAAGVAVAYGLVAGFLIYKELRVSDLRALLVKSALRACVVMFVATCAYLFAWMIAVGRVPDQMGGALQAWAQSPLTFLVLCNMVLIVVGMFMESIAAIIVIMPIVFPLALQFSIDPVHFGVLASVNFCIGMVTPPYGATLFVACSISGESVSHVAPWTLRPVLAMVVVLVLITLIPSCVTFLPRLFGL
jgi:C4-dicarboxylate transporter DctM subunit